VTDPVTAPRRGVRLRRWAVAASAAAAVLSPLLIRQDRQSVERANRLYREGDPTVAAGVYEQALERRDRGSTAYNLGTALLTLDPDSSELYLRRAAEAEDHSTAQRGLYNLGYRYLVAAERAPDLESTVLGLTGAIESYRGALRMDPTDQSARWNLALAVRRLESMIRPGEETEQESGGESEDEVAMNDPSLARSDNAEAESGPEPEDPQPADNTGERQGPREGAREAWAAQDPGPLSDAQVRALLSDVQDPAEALMIGILWAHRPDIAWWTGEEYPGGAW